MIPRRSVLAWAFYDFANSAFATTILAVIFNVYFVKVICAGGVPLFGRVLEGEAFWGLSLSASMFVVFLLSPILGALADHTGSKKKFLLLFCAMGCIGTAFLFPCVEGDYWRASFWFLLANTGFAAGNAFYNALLHDISIPENVGRVSGFGWALGYIGGGLLLAVNLMMVQKPDLFSIPAENHLPVRTSILSVALWWALFSIPIFLFVKEGAAKAKDPAATWAGATRAAWKELKLTFREIRKYRELGKYLLSYLIYNDGIETVIVMASIFGAQELGLPQGDLIACFLMIQAVAFIGALVFGWAADRVGHKLSIGATLAIYTGVCIWGANIQTRAEFWILGAIVGTILGGSQAASRSLLSLMVPREKSAQFFGFFSLTGKLSTAIGPAVFGILTHVFSLRTAVASLSGFFALGLGILYFVRVPENSQGRPQAATI